MFTNYQYTPPRLISHWFCTSNHFFLKSEHTYYQLRKNARNDGNIDVNTS